MWSSDYGHLTTIGTMVGRHEPVTLRGSDDGWAVLTIGENFEIRPTTEHVAALRDQAASTLHDAAAVHAAEKAR